ncbi:S-layer homology domain-containing protein [Paramaledivibacter caminithermalis]|jgi:hypothetical protein|uniref:S-layer homology domain-containing protein n=1 Tax=Paramaledivibacter caminithermalis (strain DSM 15212 / CIP 107654 / DViRD3) TaxID=1121301 RepID=A0A1M6L165_PARC5|nr:S-layer homology domain-containing protein [Paramaledivibacter caminithermalis]SHJ65015.1 S-layer homology domain-containing protein [Paramaledivibacter caminithermalis DSM 15212]
MKKTNKILVVLVTLSVLLLSNTIGVLALQSFTDVGDGHWAKDYIEKMEKKGIVTGYHDATFRPSENVSKLSTIVMIFRTVKAAGKLEGVNLSSLVAKHNMALSQYNIPNWAKEAVAFALEKKIVNTYELRGFFKADGTLENIKRSEASVYLGKALNYYLKEELSKNIIYLDFNDREFISTTDAPYIDLLVRKDIIKGDENRNFNPNKPIMRATAAKMFSIAYDILCDIEVKPESEKELKTEEGKIILIVDDNNSIVVENSNGNKNIYKFNNDTQILIDGKKSYFNDLDEKDNIKLYLDKDEVVVKAEVDMGLSSDSQGEVHNIVDMGGYYLLTVKDKEDSSRRRIYKVYDDVKMKLNDVEAKPSDLERGDIISLVVDGEIVKEIEAKSKTRVYEGILESGVYFEESLKIKIKTSSQKIYEFEVDEDAEVRKNNRKKSLTSLVKGDVVAITTEYGKVVKIESTSIDGDAEGVITEIILGNVNKITILDDDGNEKTYTLAPDVDIEIDDEDAEIYDLKIDYKVELEIESDVVKEIDAEEVETSDTLNGTIIEIYDDYEAIKIKVKENNETKYYSILADDVEIITVSGKTRKFRHLDKGDEIFVYCEGEDKVFDFKADKIIIVKEN